MKFIRRLLPNSVVEKKYVQAGATFGDVVSFLYLGEPIGFESMLNRWANWEEEYAHRGFRTINLDRFVDFGGYGISVDDFLGQKREKDEEPIFHAQIYRNEFLGKVVSVVNLEKVMTQGGIQTGQYRLPSTE